MQQETFVVTPFQVNCFVLYCESTKNAIVIDPGGDFETLKSFLDDNELRLDKILLTHGHIDHIGAVADLKDETNAEIYLHPEDQFLVDNAEAQAAMLGLKPPRHFIPDHELQDGQIITSGSLTFEVKTTPGHTPGGVCFVLHEHQTLFAGDTLFKESIGRTDLPGGDYEDLMASIFKKLLILDEAFVVHSGHGPSTTIGYERQMNPFLN